MIYLSHETNYITVDYTSMAIMRQCLTIFGSIIGVHIDV